MIAAGLDGVRERLDPGEPVNRNVFALSHREKRRLRIDELPGDLREAIQAAKKDPLIKEALGEHIYDHFVEAKLAAWHEYNAEVHSWETERYLARY
jgi:glutamine synthetase